MGDRGLYATWIGTTVSVVAAIAGLYAVVHPEDRLLLFFVIGVLLLIALIAFREAIRARRLAVDPAPVDWGLYARREAARERYTAFLHKVLVGSIPDLEAIRQFGKDMQAASDLFGPPIYSYLDTIYAKALQLRAVRERKQRAYRLPEKDLGELVKEDNELTAWLTAQHLELKRELAPFFDVADRRP